MTKSTVSRSDERLQTLLRELEKCVEYASRGRDVFERVLRFLAWLNRRFEELGIGRIVITGGFAVEILSGRVYRTADVDLIVEGVGADRVLEEVLKVIAERVGREWVLPPELSDRGIDIVSTACARCGDRVVRLVVDDAWIYVEPPEELVVRYLAEWRYWGSSEGLEKAACLYAALRDRLDAEYLRKRAEEEGVLSELEILERIVGRER